MAAVITDYEKVRARHHLGFLNVEAAQTFELGIPAAVQTQFMIEGAMLRILNVPGAVDLFRTLLCRCDAVEEAVFCGLDLNDVTKLDTIEVDDRRLAKHARTYKIAQEGLANLLGIVPNPFDGRSWLQGGINVAVG